MINAPQSDVFIKSGDIAFKSTSAGAPLRKLKNITDPYFGEIMLTVEEMPKIERELEKCTTVKKVVHYLKKYKENMLPTELKMFELFEAAAPVANRMKLPDLLQAWYKDSLIKLKLAEFSVIDEIDKMSQNLSLQTAFEVRKRTTDCRKILIDSYPESPFKRKDIIASLEEIIPKSGEEELLNELKEYSNNLPTSGTNENAFIVKYANRSHEEIAKRLIRLSVGTVEHILPESLGGENDIKNFMLVSSAANSMRGNTPLPNFIKRFPQVLSNIQIYIKDIMKVIERGGLRGNQSYPYKLKSTLKRESKGLINLDISEFKYKKGEAVKLEKESKLTKKDKKKMRRRR